MTKAGREIKGILMIAVIVILLEVSLFNIRHWQSLNNSQVTPEYTWSANLIQEDVNAFRVAESEDAPYIEVTGLDLDIENIAMDFTFPEMGVTAVEVIEYHLVVSDEGNKNPYPLPGMEFMHLVPQSHYDYLDLYGKARSVRLCFDNLYEGQLLRIEYFNFNSIVPLMISKKRVLALFCLLVLIYLMLPGSSLYKYTALKPGRAGRACIIGFILAELIFVVLTININAVFDDPDTPGERQFMLLAESLAQGHPYLMMDPPRELVDMDDPYDYIERLLILGDDDYKVPWDTVYFGGHYYVYFGVGPILVYYLPYYLITGSHIRTVTVVLINALLLIVGAALFVRELIRRTVDDVPLPVYLMLTFLTSFGTGLIFLLMKPDLYAVPLSMSLPLCFFGLYLWMSAIGEDKVIPWRIGLGSLCLAYEALVRPQFLLASFLALLIFWSAAFKKRLLFSKKGAAATAAFIVPYVIVAAGTMYYNYIRFGSPFDFGATYNLTANNIPYRGVRLNRLLNGTVGFLFTPYAVTNSFPYIDKALFTTSYQGPSVDENLFGGLIYNYKYLLVTLIPFAFRKYVKKREQYIYILAAPLAVLLVMLVDANVSAVITRYYVDFAWYLMAAFIIIFVCFTDKQDEETRKKIYIFLAVCFGAVLIKNFLFLFMGDARPKENMKLTWQTAKHLVEFWH